MTELRTLVHLIEVAGLLTFASLTVFSLWLWYQHRLLRARLNLAAEQRFEIDAATREEIERIWEKISPEKGG